MDNGCLCIARSFFCLFIEIQLKTQEKQTQMKDMKLYLNLSFI